MNSPREIYNKRAGQEDFCHLSEMSECFKRIIVQYEDRRFYSHHGIDFLAIRDCILDALKGKPLYGASTIPQQIVKNLYFRFEKSWTRKIKEAYLAVVFSRKLTKEELLELYLNIIYYDNGQYGIKNASRFYFDKNPDRLTVNQSVFFGTIIPFVGLYNPLYHPDDYIRVRNRKLQEKKLDEISDRIIPEVMRYTRECLDDELRGPGADTKKYDRPGPLINERFGPGQKESLI